MEHKPPTRPGFIFGLGLIVALALLDIGLAILVLTAPITPLTILRALLVLLNLAPMGLALYSLVALNSASYTLNRNAIIIRWGPAVQVIPLANIEGILQGMDLAEVMRFRGIRWPGFMTGRGRVENVGPVRFYCALPIQRQLVIKTSIGSYAISPENPDRFMDLYASQVAMGPSQEVEQVLHQPETVRGSILSDRAALILFGMGGVMNLALYLFLTSRFNNLPYTLPLRFAVSGKVVWVGHPSQLLALVAVGTAVWLANAILGEIIYRRLGERMAAYLLLGAGTGLQLLLFGAILSLARI